jgi:hypothetical protein
VLLVAMVATAACTHTRTDPTSRPSGTSSPSAPGSTPSVVAAMSYGGVTLGKAAPCLVPLPAAWRSAINRGRLWHGVWDSTTTAAPTPEGSGVLHETQNATTAHMTVLGPDRRVVEDLGQIPRPPKGQMTFNMVTSTRIAFIYSLANDESASWRWMLYLWDRAAKKMTVVAKNPIDKNGNPLPGGWVHPVLTSKYLYWITAAPTVPSGWGGSALMQYNLGTGATRTLYRGLTESLVPYGNDVLFTGLVPHPPNVNSTTNTGQGAPEQMYAVNQDSGKPVAPPKGITAGPDGAESMQSDGDLIIWNAALGALRAWRPSWGKSISLLPQDWPEGIKLGMSSPASPRLYDHFVIWQPSQTYALDLRTNTFTRLTPKPVSESGVSGSILSIEDTSTPLDVAKARGQQQWDQYVVNLKSLPGLPRCSR